VGTVKDTCRRCLLYANIATALLTVVEAFAQLFKDTPLVYFAVVATLTVANVILRPDSSAAPAPDTKEPPA
jgi:hypothetical protein